ncbi:acyltransferase [soil metagenome]
MVFLNHLSFVKQGNSKEWDWIFINIFREGYIGVSFFFILSGFILAYNYQQKFKKGSISKRQFWSARLSRILPLYYITILAAVPFTLLEFSSNSSAWIQKMFLNLFALQSFVPVYDYYFSFNLPAWSISNELFFYLLFPFLIPLIEKINIRNFLIPFGGFIIVIFLILNFIDPNNHHALFYINPFIRLFDFSLGVALFNIYKITDPAPWKSFSRASSLEITALSVLLLFFGLHQFIPEVYRFSIYYWLPMSMVIFSFSFQGGIISKWLSGKTIVLLGEISFGFYLLHHLVIRYVLALNTKFFQINSELMILFSIFIITLIASYLSYFFFESPFRKYFRRFNVKKAIPHSATPLMS